MKKLQYLVSLVLLIGLGDEFHIYSSSINSIVFLASAFVFAEEIERRRTMFFYVLMFLMIAFNPFYTAWLEIEQLRIIVYLLASIFFLLKTASGTFSFSQSNKELKEAY